MQKKLYKINLILEAIFLFLLGISLGRILPLGIVPTKYYSIILFMIVILIGILFGVSKINHKVIQIVHFIWMIFLIGLWGVAYYLSNGILEFIENIHAKEYQIEEYYVVVRKDSSYQVIGDMEGQKLAVYSSPIENYQEVFEEMLDGVEVSTVSFFNYQEAYSALINQEVNGLFLSFVEKEMLEEEEHFLDEVRILEKGTEKVVMNTVVTDKDIMKESFHIFISGIDVYGDISLVSRSDVNMIATVNPNTHEILLTSIPRDYYVRLHGTTGNRDKLTHAGLYGVDMSIQTLEDLFSIDIDYYLRVNFTTLVTLVDEIGGVDVYVDTNFRAWTNRSCTYQVGMMHLDGKCALAYARERFAYEGGDRHRIQNQQDVVKAILNKVLSSKVLITKYSSILNTFEDNLETNVPSEKIYQFIQGQLETMPSWKIEQISVNGMDSSNYTYSYPGQKLYVMEPDLSTVETAMERMKEVFS